MNGRFDYRAYELSKLGESPQVLRIKITSESGESKWLRITDDEFAVIKATLTSGTETN